MLPAEMRACVTPTRAAPPRPAPAARHPLQSHPMRLKLIAILLLVSTTLLAQTDARVAEILREVQLIDVSKNWGQGF
jgi:hypothetical protein